MKQKILAKNEKFSILKSSYGVASVIVGCTILSFANKVQADELHLSGINQLSQETVVARESSKNISQNADRNDLVTLTEAVSPEESQNYTKESEELLEGENTPNIISQQGTYTVSEKIEVKNTPSQEAPVQFYLEEGQKINYDTVLDVANRQWLSYQSYSGKRRYIDLGKQSLKTERKQEQTETLVQERNGTVTFENTVAVKNIPRQAAEIQFYFQKGDKVSYQGVEKKDGFLWLTYTSYSGAKRYMAYQKIEGDFQKNEQTKVTVKGESAKVISGRLTISNQTIDGFEIRVSEMTSNKPIDKVQIPVWTENQGQDDMVWYEANLSNDGTYRCYVPLINHRNETGLYHVHLYYQFKDKSQVGVTSKQFKVKEQEKTTALVIKKLDKIMTLDKSTEVKNAPRQSAKSEFTLEKNDKIRIDGQVEEDGQTWNTYQSYSGIRRYFLANQVENSHKKEETLTNVSKPVGGKLKVLSQTDSTLTLAIIGMTPSQNIKSVKVPVWSDDKGQDDLIWYDGVKQEDGSYQAIVQLSNHQNQAGLYHAHLYYEIENKGLIGQDKLTFSISQKNKKDDVLNSEFKLLKSSGKIEFTKTVDVKNQASQEAKTQFQFLKGDKINYDSILEKDGITWLSYTSYSGIKRYIAYKSNDTENKKQESIPLVANANMTQTGTYIFTKDTAIRNTANQTADVIAYYKKGQTVVYDKVLNENNTKWLSYQSFSGQRRYVLISQ